MELPNRLKTEGYILSKTYNPGGQSLTAIVIKDGSNFLLKRPKDLNLSTEQKFRLKQEAEALEFLNGQGTPRLIFYELGDPFILMEYIEGQTLTSFVDQKKGLDSLTALQLTFNILDIVEKIHSIPLYHRDIKPDNVIVNKDKGATLIDFGICRIDKGDRDYETPNGIELGNRFLRLPELGKGEKTPLPVSDITFVIGLLFFMLTRKNPNHLLDSNGKQPHYGFFDGADEKWLKSLFDKGFRYNKNERFQTAEEVRRFIAERIVLIVHEPSELLNFIYPKYPDLRRVHRNPLKIKEINNLVMSSDSKNEERLSEDLKILNGEFSDFERIYLEAIRTIKDIIQDLDGSVPFSIETVEERNLKDWYESMSINLAENSQRDSDLLRIHFKKDNKLKIECYVGAAIYVPSVSIDLSKSSIPICPIKQEFAFQLKILLGFPDRTPLKRPKLAFASVAKSDKMILKTYVEENFNSEVTDLNILNRVIQDWFDDMSIWAN